MKTITKTITAYTFNELSDSAKNHVRYTYFYDNPWEHDNRETLKAFVDYFPDIAFDIDQYNNVCLSEKYYNDYTLSLSGARLHRWISSNLADCKNQFGRYLIRDYDHLPLTGYYLDQDILEPLALFYLDPEKYTQTCYTEWQSATLEDVLTDCVTAFLNACERDYEYQQSDEAISENCDANEYLFTSEGTLI